MNLNTIEPAVRGQVWGTDDESKVVPAIQSYSSEELLKTDKEDLKLYTPEQMDEHAKAKVLKVLNYLTYKTDGNMAKEIMKKFFEEDMKND
ncbi:hypothetical protein LL14B4_10000 [Lactococcus lactis subsp. lactis]|uniref:Uncharacterized protein n=1 Tax=Lactococcus lactis subsp. lactis TaxID=1360 RepID=A0A2Z3KGC3_LACLL|nr:hypothetical protein [Lactococcus lactis]AWN66488.1 hypothetical protein LL14B4_10000 [Lactococcus lactis subsp. lactis]